MAYDSGILAAGTDNTQAVHMHKATTRVIYTRHINSCVAIQH